MDPDQNLREQPRGSGQHPCSADERGGSGLSVQREYLYERGIETLKVRNARVRELTADGWNVEAGGSKQYGYSVSAWKGEKPVLVRHRFGLRDGTHGVTPLYRSKDGDGFEFADGSKE